MSRVLASWCERCRGPIVGTRRACPTCGTETYPLVRGRWPHRRQDKDLGPAVAHHDAVRAEAAREREACGEVTWQAVLRRTEADHGGHACELCDQPASEDNLEPHHLEGGSGRRRQAESVSNVMAACRTCHEACHANVRAFVARVVAWCKAHLYRLPDRKEYRNHV